ncbi:MAG: enoyl-CoA hydratase/isomerase family protein [Deltaproteobacteria bacterium]|nr:enoyl-CoA hydratase/isomerase family protein [Deltaproteobacteria bacterium]
MEYKNIVFEVEENVATIMFNRPKALNAMNSETMGEFMDAIKTCYDDDSIKAVIVTGAGEKAFVAGADIVEMQDLEPCDALKFMERGHETYRALELLPKPTIAAVRGFALGGGTEITMSCDIRFAADNARFGQPEILLGLTPGWGGTQRLPRIIGIGRALELLMSGEQVNAQRAYEIGLVNRVFPADQLMEETKKFAKKLAAMPAFAIKMMKHAVNFGQELPLDHANRLEMECCAQCFSTKDQKEGMKAFVEKRKANFIGR